MQHGTCCSSPAPLTRQPPPLTTCLPGLHTHLHTLAQYRPARDLKDTLLHEMIHADIFLRSVKDDGDHGSHFKAAMRRINAATCPDPQVLSRFVSWVSGLPCQVDGRAGLPSRVCVETSLTGRARCVRVPRLPPAHSGRLVATTSRCSTPCTTRSTATAHTRGSAAAGECVRQQVVDCAACVQGSAGVARASFTGSPLFQLRWLTVAWPDPCCVACVLPGCCWWCVPPAPPSPSAATRCGEP